MFEFDIASTILTILVVIGIMFLANALGSAVSRLSPYIFAGMAVLFGILLWIGIVDFLGSLSFINFVGYLLYLFQKLQPFGWLIFGNAILTLASCLVFVLEVGLVTGFADARIRQRRKFLQSQKVRGL